MRFFLRNFYVGLTRFSIVSGTVDANDAKAKASTIPNVDGGLNNISRKIMSIAIIAIVASFLNFGLTRGFSSESGAMIEEVDTPTRIPGADNIANGIHATMNGKDNACMSLNPQYSGLGLSSHPATGSSIPRSPAINPGITSNVPSQIAPNISCTFGN